MVHSILEQAVPTSSLRCWENSHPLCTKSRLQNNALCLMIVPTCTGRTISKAGGDSTGTGRKGWGLHVCHFPLDISLFSDYSWTVTLLPILRLTISVNTPGRIKLIIFATWKTSTAFSFSSCWDRVVRAHNVPAATAPYLQSHRTSVFRHMQMDQESSYHYQAVATMGFQLCPFWFSFNGILWQIGVLVFGIILLLY